MLLNSLEAVFIIFVIIGVGLFVSWRKWVSRETAKALPKIIINISLPATIAYNIYQDFPKERLINAWLPLLIIFAVTVAVYYLAMLAAWLLRIPRHRRGVFIVSMAFSNSSFIGFPVAVALFGEEGMLYAVLYFLAGLVTFWLIGNYAIERDADAANGHAQLKSIGQSIKKLAQPPTVATVIIFIIILAGIKLPDFILSTAKYIGDLNTPLSLIFIGCMIYNMGFAGMKWEKDLAPVLLGRFVVVPLVCFVLSTLGVLLFTPTLTAEHIFMREVFVVQIGLPALMQTVISAEVYGADTEFATKCIFYTTALSLITIPAFMLLLSAA